MHVKKHIRYIFVCLLLLIVGNSSVYSQSDREKRSLWIFNIAEGISWTNEDSISVFKIGVYSNKVTYETIKKLAKHKTIHGKPVKVKLYENHTELTGDDIHILYITREKNPFASTVYQKLKTKNVLIVSDRLRNKLNSVINFRRMSDQSKPFSINTTLARAQNLKIADKLLKLGGSDKDIRQLVSKTDRELRKEKETLKEKQEEIQKKQKELDKLVENLAKQDSLIKQKEKDIELKNKEIANKTTLLDSNKLELEAINNDLLNRKKLVLKQKKLIEKRKAELKEQEDKIKLINVELKEKEKKLLNKDKKLGETQQVVETQKNTIYSFYMGVTIIAILLIIILKNNVKKAKINKKLKEQNIAINKHKEEIISQAKELETINSELKRLSIVASKTDNAVTILDKNGDFEWVNAGFTRMYGYTLQLLKNELDKNIITASDNINIKEIFKKARSKKETIIYENEMRTRSNKTMWIQTTLNPILDVNGEIERFITIDTDISKLKKAEIAIRNQSKELLMHQSELKTQNKRIEMQNRQIKASIRYAKNIQTAILPSKKQLHELFNSFIIFRPKDIVSGDFYWYAKLPARKGLSEKIFVAVVDCTGHGVPGAFMSLVANSLLNKIVLESKIVNPAQILEKFDLLINSSLRQHENNNHDGMDITLCRFEEKPNNQIKVKYAGAKLPVYIKRRTMSKVEVCNGTRRSIGGVFIKNKRPFETKTFMLGCGDYLWLSSDGYIDQNDISRKRFGTPRFLKLLDLIKDKPLNEQKEKLEHMLDNFMQGVEQRDDITVLGIEIRRNSYFKLNFQLESSMETANLN